MLFPSKLIKQEYPFIFFLSFLCVVEYLIFQTLSHTDANVFIDVDEIEHLRASYNILAGRIPFRDFFEHHHLLLNYLFTPVVFLFPKDPVIILIARFFIYGILFLIVAFSFKILSFLHKKTLYAEILSSILLPVTFFSLAVFNGHIFHFRPDSLMCLFLLLSILCFFMFLKEKNYTLLSLSFIASALSFLSLQKSLIYLPIIPCFCIYLLYKKEIKFKALVFSCIPAIFTLLSYVYYLYYTDSLSGYFNCNILVNQKITALFSHGKLQKDPFYYFLYFTLFCIPFFLYRNKNIYGLTLSCFFIISFISSYFFNPFRQYLIPSIVFIPLILTGTVLPQTNFSSKKTNVKFILYFLSFSFVVFQFQKSVLSIQKHISTTHKILSYVDDKSSISEVYFLWFNLYNPSVDYFEFHNELFTVIQQHNIPLPHFNPIDRLREKKPELIIIRFGFKFPEDLLPFYTKLPDLPNVYLKKK